MDSAKGQSVKSLSLSMTDMLKSQCFLIVAVGGSVGNNNVLTQPFSL